MAAGGPKLQERCKMAAEILATGLASGICPEAALLGVRGAEGVIRLQSRQGSCFLISIAGQPSIFAKLLSDEAKAENETYYAKMVSGAGISCPRIEAQHGRAIARRYIEGKSASDELEAIKEWGDAQSAARLCFKMGKILAQVHSLRSKAGHGIIVKDANLRNFIVSTGNKLSIIDLADASEGDQAEDLGGLLIHIMTHRPAFSHLSWDMARAALSGYESAAGYGNDWRWYANGIRRAFAVASARRSDPGLLAFIEEACAKLAPKAPEGKAACSYEG